MSNEHLAVREIPLTKGYVAVVDAGDYEWLSKFKWQVSVQSGTAYAKRHLGCGYGDATASLHRTIMLPDPGQRVDHINHDGLDNRRTNLRLCTQSLNCGNQRVSERGTSRYKGVFWNKQCRKWTAFIKVDYQNKYLGLFSDEAEAARAYDITAREYFGEFSLTNFPPGGGCHE
jgi:hypothetical protein